MTSIRWWCSKRTPMGSMLSEFIRMSLFVDAVVASICNTIWPHVWNGCPTGEYCFISKCKLPFAACNISRTLFDISFWYRSKLMRADAFAITNFILYCNRATGYVFIYLIDTKHIYAGQAHVTTIQIKLFELRHFSRLGVRCWLLVFDEDLFLFRYYYFYFIMESSCPSLPNIAKSYNNTASNAHSELRCRVYNYKSFIRAKRITLVRPVHLFEYLMTAGPGPVFR